MLTQIFRLGGTLLMILFSGLADSLLRAVSLAGEANRTILNIRKRELVNQARLRIANIGFCRLGNCGAYCQW